MPTDQIPGDLLAGPYGFLVAIAFFLYLASREWRRARQIDVTTYQGDVRELTARMTARDEQHRLEVAALQDDLSDVKTDLAALRDDNTTQARQAALRHEALIRENAQLRAVLAEHPEIPTPLLGQDGTP